MGVLDYLLPENPFNAFRDVRNPMAHTPPGILARAVEGAPAMLEGMWNTFTTPGDILMGKKPATIEDAAKFALDVGLIGFGGSAPKGALRSGGARNAKGLPRDEASRMARAREMGHTVPMYHATNAKKDFEAFKSPSRASLRPGDWAIYGADHPAVAGEFGSGNGQRVLPLLGRGAKKTSIDLPEGVTDHEVSATLADLWDNGYDFVRLKNYTTPGGKTGQTIYAVRDPNQLRSRFADFDPAKAWSDDLLATAAPPIPYSALEDDQDTTGILRYLRQRALEKFAAEGGT